MGMEPGSEVDGVGEIFRDNEMVAVSETESDTVLAWDLTISKWIESGQSLADLGLEGVDGTMVQIDIRIMSLGKLIGIELPGSGGIRHFLKAICV